MAFEEIPTDMTKLEWELWKADGVITNQAAREIARLRSGLLDLRKAWEDNLAIAKSIDKILSGEHK